MTEKEVSRYLGLVSRRMFILTHSGIDWKPEYGPELEQINRRLAKLRKMIDAEHNRIAQKKSRTTMMKVG